jgi:hypothetical protein
MFMFGGAVATHLPASCGWAWTFPGSNNSKAATAQRAAVLFAMKRVLMEEFLVMVAHGAHRLL